MAGNVKTACANKYNAGSNAATTYKSETKQGNMNGTGSVTLYYPFQIVGISSVVIGITSARRNYNVSISGNAVRVDFGGEDGQNVVTVTAFGR